jgi:ABC-type multidrug transport system ATPase subunit
MEEADYLSDRIMILQNGQVKAIGSSLFLKHTYGTGYQVRLIVEPKITEVVKKEIVKVRTHS